jgi:hypothetical protein
MLAAEFIRANKEQLRELQADIFPNRYPRIAKKLNAPRFAADAEASNVRCCRSSLAWAHCPAQDTLNYSGRRDWKFPPLY